jgi:hypothetical protein
VLEDFERAEQSYLENTAILETRLYDTHGACIKLTDFAPRFEQFERTFHPYTFVRHLEPLAGNPRVTVRLRPAGNYGAEDPRQTFGSNHVRYLLPDLTLRLTTDAPLTYVREERPFRLSRPVSFILGPDESLQESVARTSRQYFEQTHSHWQRLGARPGRALRVAGSGDPRGDHTEALRLRGHRRDHRRDDHLDPRGRRHSTRNWDYRYCWLRDSFFVVHALNRLGATRTMEAYLDWILNVAATSDGKGLQPVYGIDGETELTETLVPHLPGYRGHGPVRVGNQAHEQVQNDVYGAVVLSAAQVFFRSAASARAAVRSSSNCWNRSHAAPRSCSTSPMPASGSTAVARASTPSPA